MYLHSNAVNILYILRVIWYVCTVCLYTCIWTLHYVLCLYITKYICLELNQALYSSCEDGDVRLVNGSSVLEGRLEICVNHVWGTVCDRRFGTSEAEVACRKLGFASGMLKLFK